MGWVTQWVFDPRVDDYVRKTVWVNDPPPTPAKKGGTKQGPAKPPAKPTAPAKDKPRRTLDADDPRVRAAAAAARREAQRRQAEARSKAYEALTNRVRDSLRQSGLYDRQKRAPGIILPGRPDARPPLRTDIRDRTGERSDAAHAQQEYARTQQRVDRGRTEEAAYRALTERQTREARQQAANQRARTGGEAPDYRGTTQRRIDEAAKTGNWEGVLDQIISEQAATGGRFLDRKALALATQGFQAERDKAEDAFTTYILPANKALLDLEAAEAAGDRAAAADARKRLIEAVSQEGYLAAYEEYVRVYGAYGEGGTNAGFFEKYNQIVETNDQYFYRVLTGSTAPLTGPTADRQMEDINRRLNYGKRFYEDPADPDRILSAEYHRPLSSYLDDLEREAVLREKSALERIGLMSRDAGRHGNQEAVVYMSMQRDLGEDQMAALVAQLDSPSRVESQKAFDALAAAAMRDWVRRNPAPVLPDKRAYMGSEEWYAWDQRRRRFEDHVYRLLTSTPGTSGTGAPGDVEKYLGQVLTVPGLSHVFSALQFLGAGVTGSLRLVQAIGQFRIMTPDLNLDAFFGSGKPLLEVPGSFVTLSNDPEVIGRNLRASQEFIDEWLYLLDKGEYGDAFEAWYRYSAEPVEGNVGNLIALMALDPTIALSVTRFVGAGRLALLRQGTVARARGLAAGLNPFKWAGGTSATEIKNVNLLTHLRREGIVPDTVTRLADVENLPDALRELRARYVGAADKATEMVEPSLLRARRQNTQQLLGSIEAELARLYGAKSAAEIEERLAQAARFIDSADTLVGAAARTVRRAPRAAQEAEALAAFRAGRGLRPAGLPSPVPLARTAHARRGPVAALERQVIGVRRSQAELRRLSALIRGDRGEDFADLMRRASGKGDDAKRAQAELNARIDPDARRQAFADLEAELVRAEGLINPTPGRPGAQAAVPDSLRTAIRAVNALDVRYGYLVDDVTSLGKVEAAVLARDTRLLSAEIARLRALAASTTASAAVKADARRRLRDAGAAMRRLAFEKDVSSGLDGAERDLLRRYGGRARSAVSDKKVTGYAETPQQVETNLFAELNGLYRSGFDAPDVIGPLGAAQRARVTKAGSLLAKLPLLWDEGLRPFWALFDGESIWDAFELLTSVRLNSSLDAMQEAAYRSVVDQVMVALGMAPNGIDALKASSKAYARALKSVNELGEFMSRMHISEPGMAMSEYRRVNGIVTAAVKRVRGWEASGTARLGAKTGGRGGVSRYRIRVDDDLAIAKAKRDALRSHGLSLWAYDDASTVLRDAMLREGVGLALLRGATRLARRGGTVVEHFKALRTRRAGIEARRALARESRQYLRAGFSAEDAWDVFTEAHLRSDLSAPRLAVRSAYQMDSLYRSMREISGIADLSDEDAVRRFLQRDGRPPLDNHAELLEWLRDRGYWAPRTANQVRRGGAVWSIEQERNFFTRMFGEAPPWAVEANIVPLLDDHRLYQQAFKAWGFFDDSFEVTAGDLMLDSKFQKLAVAYGAEGLAKRGRTWQELRQWAIGRYGDLVARKYGDGRYRLTAMPWLMDVTNPEYVSWVADYTTRTARSLPNGMMPVEGIDAFAKAVTNATKRRVARVEKALGSTVDPGEWMPEEMLVFAHEVADELLMSKPWQRFWAREGLVTRLFSPIGYLQRLAIAWQPAFPIMNLVDRWGVKPLLLRLRNSDLGFFWAIDDEFADLALPETVAEAGLYELRGADGLRLARDPLLPTSVRAKGAIKAALDAPFMLSASERFGETGLKQGYFRRLVQERTYSLVDDLGMEFDAAKALAIEEATQAIKLAFPSLQNAGPVEKWLNMMVPFFSYNFNNKVFGLSVVWGRPWIAMSAERLGRFLEAQNREIWAQTHPDGEPMPDNLGRRLFVHLDGETYTVDLSNFSDWFRGPEVLSKGISEDGLTLERWLSAFVRIPHPNQWGQIKSIAAALGFAGYPVIGGETPWGTKPNFLETIGLAELMLIVGQYFGWLPGSEEGEDPTAVQVLSRALFFKAFDRLDIWYPRYRLWLDKQFSGDREGADALLEKWPDLVPYIEEKRRGWGDAIDHVFDKPYDFFASMTQADRLAYDEARRGLDGIREDFDRQLAGLILEPWSPRARELRKYRRAAYMEYRLRHPELIDSGVFFGDDLDWADFEREWLLDEQVDAYFREWGEFRPSRSDLTELERAREYQQWLKDREAFLRAFPSIAAVLRRDTDAVSAAFADRDDQWREILAYNAAIKVRILEEKEKEYADRDQELLDALYELQNANYKLLDQEAFGQVFAEEEQALMDSRMGNNPIASGRGLPGSIARLFRLPGRQEYFDTISPPTEEELKRRGLNRDIGAIARSAGKNFWAELSKHPDLLAEYIKDDEARERWIGWRLQQVYAEAERRGVNFYEVLQQDPWLLAEYFRRKPEKRASYLAGKAYRAAMGRWVELLSAKDYDAANRYFDSLPSWIKERYYSRHPEKRLKAVRNAAYIAAMGRWVELLKAKDYVAAKKYFDALPKWMKDKYYDKHPEQRPFDLHPNVFAAVQAYLLSTDPDQRAAILKANPAAADYLRRKGGSEEQRRGLILALYYQTPKEDSWLKRVIRERYPEIFSKEAQGQRRLDRVARKLAENPELVDLYKRLLKQEYEAYQSNLQGIAAPPKELELVRAKQVERRKKKRKRRIARSTVGVHRLGE